MSSMSLSSAAALLVPEPVLKISSTDLIYSQNQPEEASEYPKKLEKASEYPRQPEEASEYPKQPEEASEYLIRR